MTEQYGLPKYAIEKICQLLQEYPSIERTILYGSRAKGNYRHGSDIDLVLQAPDMNLSTLLSIENKIDDLLLPWTVDLSLLHQIDNQDLLEHIARVSKDFSIN